MDSDDVTKYVYLKLANLCMNYKFYIHRYAEQTYFPCLLANKCKSKLEGNIKNHLLCSRYVHSNEERPNKMTTTLPSLKDLSIHAMNISKWKQWFLRSNVSRGH